MPLYLLHSTVPLGTNGRNSARHYLGFVPHKEDLPRRIAEHQSGRSDVRIVRAYLAAGAELLVGRTWDYGTRSTERRLKRLGHLNRHCTICCQNEGVPLWLMIGGRRQTRRPRP